MKGYAYCYVGINMNEQINQILPDIIAAISDNYSKSDVILTHPNKSLPVRKTIIDSIKTIQDIMFPCYFNSENVNNYNKDAYIGYQLSNLHDALKEQVRIALDYSSTKDISYEELNSQAEDICCKFFETLPTIQSMLLLDIQAGFEGDPAASSMEQIIFSYPGFYATLVYRVAHELYLLNVPFIPRIMTEHAHSKTGIDINAGATIGKYFFMDHGTGIVIGETTEIGDYVKLYQGVTLGALSTRAGQQLSGVKRHPTIQDRVTIYSNATILGGDTLIGSDSIIGGGAFITSAIPSGTRVSVTPPEQQIKNGQNNKN